LLVDATYCKVRLNGRAVSQAVVVATGVAALPNAIAAVLPRAARQRCRKQFVRNVLAKATKGTPTLVAATVRTIFAPRTRPLVRELVDVVAGGSTAASRLWRGLLGDARPIITDRRRRLELSSAFASPAGSLWVGKDGVGQRG
jgi:Transposase, Mutator family